jgi:hypothetical protein
VECNILTTAFQIQTRLLKCWGDTLDEGADVWSQRNSFTVKSRADVLIHLMLIAGVLFGTCSCSEVAGGLGVNSSKPDQIRCQAGPDCDLKWQRAYTWVVKSSGLKLKTKTDGLIKTVGPPEVDVQTLVVIITKNPTEQSSIYEIDFIGKCSSLFSCVPSAAETRARFADFVFAAD